MRWLSKLERFLFQTPPTPTYGYLATYWYNKPVRDFMWKLETEMRWAQRRGWNYVWLWKFENLKSASEWDRM